MNEIISNLIIVVATAVLTFWFTDRSKRREHLYQNRIEAFKAIFRVVAGIKRFALGQMALRAGAETAPYFDEPGAPLPLRDALARIREENDIFLTTKSREKLNDLDSTLSSFASAVLGYGIGNDDIDYTPLKDAASEAEQVLYRELGLPTQ